MRTKNLKSQSLQTVPHQHGNCFPVDHVGGGFTTSQIIIIHAGQIIVHEAVAVDQLDRGAWSPGDLGRVCAVFPDPK